ncbi:MAG: alpha/beta hydrolase [Planctomycetota bacterium]|nr:alpha/beta hydrolase [Planctomycetota bacterium]
MNHVKTPASLIFLSGLGSTPKLFALQKEKFPQLLTPPWLKPIENESVDHYLERWVKQLNLTEPVIVGGASFGGMIAQRIASKIGANHCLLFGSIKSRSEIPWRIRLLRPVHRLAFKWIIRFWQIVVLMFVWLFGFLISQRTHSVLRQFSSSDPTLVKWSIRVFFQFFDDHSSSLLCRNQLKIHQIHGTHDPVFPASLIEKNEQTEIHFIQNAGHLLTLSAADQVNSIISQVISSHSQFKANDN